MAVIPKNVMQIGQTDAHVKIYMEDYVHTFLERCGSCGECLAFGRKEESEGISYYLIYGVEKRQDWDRGSFPYFKNLERIGEITGVNGELCFKTVQGREIPVEGYFIFYEQNEDMQSYMIAERENREAETQRERERVMEEVQLRREKRKQEAEQQGHPAGTENGKRDMPSAGRALRSRYLRANAAVSQRISCKNPGGGRMTLAGVCRVGCLALLLVLAATALTSLNRYPDMKAVTALFSDAAGRFGKKDDASLIVEEVPSGITPLETADGADFGEDGADGIPVQADGEWLIGGSGKKDEGQDAVQETAISAAETEPAAPAEKETAQAEKETPTEPAAPEEQAAAEERDASEEQTEPKEQTVTAEPAVAEATGNYTVQRGDSLAKIARRFYGSTAYVSKICDLNQIEDPDRITPGQNILLP